MDMALRRGQLRGAAGGLLAATMLFALAPAPSAVATPKTVAEGNGSMVMVLDSSGSMADKDGSGGTRIASARKAVGTVVDSLPDDYPTGLRLYGSDKEQGCTDTRLAKPVRPLDRAGIKDAVAKVRPKGDTPIGYSLRKAAKDLPKLPEGAIGQRTILLISDGEDNCGDPEPCEVAGELAKRGIDLRIDAIGFQVRGKAREQLECVAREGNGAYYDAPDADALARQLQRAGRLSADGYRFKGKKIRGGSESGDAATISSESGQYLDTIGPGEKRWYAVQMDAASTTGFAATAVPKPGSAVRRLDGLTTELTAPQQQTSACDTSAQTFGQDEGGVPLVSNVSRIPAGSGTSGRCDEGRGRYLISVERASADDGAASDAARWPLELTYGVEKPLKKGVTLAQSETELGAGGRDATLPQSTPKKTRGGTGFNDATKIGKGVWRDKVLPSQTLWYRVPVGWGQQLRYDVEFSNEPTADEFNSDFAFSRTDTYAPHRQPVSGALGELAANSTYNGQPGKVSGGTVPVSWTNRWEGAQDVTPVHADGDYYIAVTLGANASRIAENPDVGITLRVDVKGQAKAGPQHNAPAAKTGTGAHGADSKGSPADSGAADSAGWIRPAVAVVGGGLGVLLLAGLAWWFVRARRGGGGSSDGGSDAMRGGAW
jgi:Ca-activated chloride channel homolog